MSRPVRATAALAGLLLAAGCGAPKNTVEGSLGEVVDLRFDTVRVTFTAPALTLAWERAHGEGTDVVLKLVVQLSPEMIAGGGALDLAPGADGIARATLGRAVADDPVRDFAPIRSGLLTLSSAPEIEKGLSGEFRVTLGGDGPGEGRTAFAPFSVGRVEAAAQ